MTPGSPTFGGDLGLIGLFDLGQLLMLNRASGCLTVIRENGKGHLWFDQGQIVNAVDDAYAEGEGAAYRIFTWKTGKFAFRPEAPNGTRTIDGGTEGLMLEAARRMDEESLAEGGAAGGHTERLMQHQGAMEALRDVFANLAREARALDASGVGGASAAPLDALTGPSDLLVLRPGHPARLRLLGTWREARDAALSATDYADLKSRLLTGAARSAVARLPGGRSIEVTLVGSGENEALWLRPVGLPAPNPGRIDGPLAELQEAFEWDRGLLLVAGPDADVATRLLHALLASLLPRYDRSVVIVADAPSYRQAEGAGIVLELRSAELGAALESISPETLVLDEGGAIPAGAFSRLEPVGWLMVRVTAPTAESALERWRARLAPEDLRSFDLQFGLAPAWVAMAAPAGADPDRIPFTLSGTDGERASAPRPRPAEAPGRGASPPRRAAA